MPNKEVAKIVGISASVCSTYYSLYKKEGNKVFITPPTNNLNNQAAYLTLSF